MKNVWLAGALALAVLGGAGCGLLRGGTARGPEPRWEDSAPYPGAPAATNVATDEQKEKQVNQLAGETNETVTAAYRLKVGDVVNIIIRAPAAENFEMAIDENGNIKLPYIDTVPAVGLTPTELEARIKRTYLDKKIFRMMTVNVFVPLRSYFVRGEVRSPGRFPLTTGMTLLQAVVTAGGFTEYADERDVRVIRGERRMRYSIREIEAHPEKDMAIEAGDVIVVTRRFL